MKTFSTEYTAKNLTKHAGLVNLGKFAEKIGLPRILEKRLTIERGATAEYEMSEIVMMLMMLMMGVLAGAKHMSHLMILKADHAIRKLFGWKLFPDASSFGKLFKLFTMGHCHELSEAEAEARKRVWSKKSPFLWMARICSWPSALLVFVSTAARTGIVSSNGFSHTLIPSSNIDPCRHRKTCVRQYRENVKEKLSK